MLQQAGQINATFLITREISFISGKNTHTFLPILVYRTLLAGGYGQNLAASSPTASISVHISDYWYNGEMPLYAGLYGESEPSGSGYGHFTQVIWKDSTSVGCGTVDCTSSSLGMWYTVCNYWPAGKFTVHFSMSVRH